MEMTEIDHETPLAAEMESVGTPAAASSSEISDSEIPSSEMGHSLLALIQTHERSEAAPAENANPLTEHLEPAEQRQPAEQLQPARMYGAQAHSLRMAEMYLAIGQLLELLHERVVGDPSQQAANQSAGSIAEIQQLIESSEERHFSTIEATLKQWQSERRSQEADRVLQMESLQVQSQIEVNRLLRVMWLGTGLAATGAGLALFLMSN